MMFELWFTALDYEVYFSLLRVSSDGQKIHTCDAHDLVEWAQFFDSLPY